MFFIIESNRFFDRVDKRVKHLQLEEEQKKYLEELQNDEYYKYTKEAFEQTVMGQWPQQHTSTYSQSSDTLNLDNIKHAIDMLKRNNIVSQERRIIPPINSRLRRS